MNEPGRPQTATERHADVLEAIGRSGPMESYANFNGCLGDLMRLAPDGFSTFYDDTADRKYCRTHSRTGVPGRAAAQWAEATSP